MSDPGTCTEREIAPPVSALYPRRAPEPRCRRAGRAGRSTTGLPGTWGRRKRWDFWGVTGPGFALNLVYADVDYVGIADVWFHDFGAGRRPPTGRSRCRSPVGCALPTTVAGGDMRFTARGLVLVDRRGGRRHPPAGRVRRRTTMAGSPPTSSCAGRPSHESLSVVIPWSDRRFQFTNKDVGRPAEGSISWGDRSYVLGRGHVVGHARLRARQVAVPHALELGCRRGHGRPPPARWPWASSSAASGPTAPA